jgi:3,4-dihydroxy 2-butanone 4-phosphate synthase/GTP cyclohydrolase II
VPDVCEIQLAPIPEVLEALRGGAMVILVDDEGRENEGDLLLAAEKVTPEVVNFMATHGRGLICVPLGGARCERLQLPQQTSENTAHLGTAFTISVDARTGITTGISAADRARTVEVLADDRSRPADLVRPGHIFPIRARDGGVLVRAGQTEGGVDLCRMAGLKPVAVVCEIMNADGRMARRPELARFAQRHGLLMCSVAQVIRHRLQREKLVHRIETVQLPTRWGEFRLIAYRSDVDDAVHLALCKGGVGALDADERPIVHDEPVMVRLHSECLTGDVFGSLRCDCGEQLIAALDMVEQAGKGAVVYLRQEGRGIGLVNKLHAYKLQEHGLDTVEANEALGLPADRRDYGVGSQILRDLGLRRLRVLTNNPRKIYGLEAYGLSIVERLPIHVEPHALNRKYLKTKADKLGHLLEGL